MLDTRTPPAQRWISADSLSALATSYPGKPCALTHALQDHPLFALGAIADLAARLPDSHVEHSLGKLKVDQDPSDIERVALPPAEIVRGIADNGCWMVLKKVDSDPAYAALIDALLAEIAPVTAAATGPYRRREAFIFLSAPNSVTPFHMDPEHNILLQIAGENGCASIPPTAGTSCRRTCMRSSTTAARTATCRTAKSSTPPRPISLWSRGRPSTYR